MVDREFDAEIFDYWIPRLVADGVDANDVQTVRPHVSSWDDWPGAWSNVGNEYLKIADTRLSDKSTITASEAFVRASLCFHVGQVVAGNVPDLKIDLQRKKEAAFQKAAPLLNPPAERLVVDHDGIPLPGYLRLPSGAEGPVPCVILVPGLDSTKEDFITLSDMCVGRGMASFAYDGPGQGEVRQHALLADGYENSILTVFEAIAARPEVDQTRIGLLGRSLGGFYILRAAATEPRIKALAVFGGTYDLGDWEKMPKTILDGFLWTTDSSSYNDARKKMGAGTVEDCIDRIFCPTIIVHGKLDSIFHFSQAERIAKSLGSNAELHIAEAGVHCCHNKGFQYRTLMADWFSRIL